jgi:hypothetical protein
MFGAAAGADEREELRWEGGEEADGGGGRPRVLVRVGGCVAASSSSFLCLVPMAAAR